MALNIVAGDHHHRAAGNDTKRTKRMSPTKVVQRHRCSLSIPTATFHSSWGEGVVLLVINVRVGNWQPPAAHQLRPLVADFSHSPAKKWPQATTVPASAAPHPLWGNPDHTWNKAGLRRRAPGAMVVLTVNNRMRTALAGQGGAVPSPTPDEVRTPMALSPPMKSPPATPRTGAWTRT